MAELAAEAADEAPRASIMAAPRFATVGMNVFSIHERSSTWAAALRPLTLQLKRSGYCVTEWLPQIVMRLTAVTGRPSFWAICVTARLWSRRVIAVNCLGLMFGALFIAISALVLAGLPTTSTLTFFLALSDRALPCGLKMPPLAASRSERSMPALRGIAPMSSA